MSAEQLAAIVARDAAWKPDKSGPYHDSIGQLAESDRRALLALLRETREALAAANQAGAILRGKAERTAISAEDWRYTNGFDAGLKFFEPLRAVLAALGDS